MTCLATLAHRLAVRGRRGMAAAEFALSLPVLLLLLFAAVDYGRATAQAMQLTNALRGAAQYALSYPDDPAGITNHIRMALGDEADAILGALTVTTQCECEDNGAGASLAACATLCQGRRLVILRASRPFSPIFFNTIETVQGDVTLRSQ